MQLRLLLAVGALFVAPSIAAAQGTLVVLTTVAGSGEPLPYVDVTISQIHAGAIGKESGTTTLTRLPAGTVDVRVRRVGFRPVVQSVTLTGGTDTLRVALERLAIVLPEVRSKDVACPARGTGDTMTLALIDQMRTNADRSRLLTEQYPLIAVMERKLYRSNRMALKTDSLDVSGRPSWKYSAGGFMQESGGGPVLMLPQLSDFASDAFAATHCFRYGGREIVNGAPRLKLEFEPTRDLKDPDLHGVILLDPDHYRMTDANLVFDRQRVGSNQADVEAQLEFSEVVAGVSLARRVCAQTTFVTTGLTPTVLRESQRLVGADFLQGAPGPVALDTSTVACAWRR